MPTPSNRAPAPDAGDERRRQIVAWMQRHPGPVSGTDLASRFSVSRQSVVQDIAILRASGTEILATPRGYRLPDASAAGHCEVLACDHPASRTEEELQILVDHGVKVLDVIVEHPLYGELRGSLMIESRADVQDFLVTMRAKKASLLSSLTDGIHLHTVEARSPELVSRAKSKLREKGFLLK
jgi:uncharacterized protein